MSNVMMVQGVPFFDSGETFVGGPVPPVEAQVCAHDYAHEGCYFRIVRVGVSGHRTVWGVYVRPGRQVLPACCRPRKRTYVDEPTPPETWERRLSDVERRRLERMVS